MGHLLTLSPDGTSRLKDGLLKLDNLISNLIVVFFGSGFSFRAKLIITCILTPSTTRLREP